MSKTKELSIKYGRKHIENLNTYYGDILELVEPIYNIWDSNKQFVFARYKNLGFRIDVTKPSSIVKNILEAGGGDVLRIELKNKI